MRSSEKLYRLDCGGIPVGLFDSAAYEHASIRLQPGDVLACFSDGITEARNRDGQMWDESRVDEILSDNLQSSSSELVQKLVQGADDYMGAAEQADDITIVILRVLY